MRQTNVRGLIWSIIDPNIVKQIEGMEKAIDKIVYELYGLTEDEVKVVEGG
jgi:hypothetical protein